MFRQRREGGNEFFQFYRYDFKDAKTVREFLALDGVWWDYFTQDFVQNDPFLRDPVIFMLSRGRERDERLVRQRFPGARFAGEAPFGHVWRLD